MSSIKTEQTQKSRSKVVIILVLILIVIVIFFASVIIYLLSNQNKTIADNNTESAGAVEIEGNIILDDPKSLQDAVDEMYRKAEEGRMTLEMQVETYSQDGENFSCFLANAKENNYEMYMILYRDDTQEEIYRSGLIPIGARIENFTTTVKLEPGTYVGTLVYCQVEEDGETIHAQVNVGLNLHVDN